MLPNGLTCVDIGAVNRGNHRVAPLFTVTIFLGRLCDLLPQQMLSLLRQKCR